VIADPRAVAARWPEPRLRALAELACVTTEAPWELTRAHHARARAAGLSDDEVLHAIALAAFFGHLNRIADAVEIPLDYDVRREPPRAERAVPPFHAAPAPVSGEPALALSQRAQTAERLAAWMSHVARPSAALDGARRSLIATRVGRLLGGATAEAAPRDAPRDAIDHALIALADRITLAPWTLDAASYAPLRAAGFTDRDVFDACVVATSAGMSSRIEVALIALGR
jgi:alkylhydroperoxidase family enzyme